MDNSLQGLKSSSASADGVHNCCGGYHVVREECCEWAEEMESDHITVQKVEPKLFFANERTFIKWLHMGVILSSISVGVLAFSGSDSEFITYIIVCLFVQYIKCIGSRFKNGIFLYIYLLRSISVLRRVDATDIAALHILCIGHIPLA